MGWTPVPVRLTTCVLGTSESVMVRVPVSTPTAVGTNLTVILQLRPGAKLVPQVVLSEKFLVHAMLLIATGAVPTLATVTIWPALVVPTIWLPNNSDVVLSRIELTTCVAGAEADPIRLVSPA